MRKRNTDVATFYSLLELLRERSGGARTLRDCTGRMDWPARGVYFFFEEGEFREERAALRVVRVGTHALTLTSRTSMWNRLAQHRGTITPAGGNHRGSIFRLLVGDALLRSGRFPGPVATWGIGASASREVRASEVELEARVSQVIGAMPLLWLPVGDAGGPSSLRGYIERNAIALVSNYSTPVIDPPSASWLGRFSQRVTVARSGLWNSNHVGDPYDSAFLDTMEKLIETAHFVVPLERVDA